MKKFIKKGVIATSIIGVGLTTTLVNAITVEKTIKVLFNTVNVLIDNQKLDGNIMLYNDEVYIPLRKAAELYNSEITWDSITKTVNITQQPYESSIIKPVIENTEFGEIEKLLKISREEIEDIIKKRVTKFGYVDYDNYEDTIEDYEKIIYIGKYGTENERLRLEKALKTWGYDFDEVEDRIYDYIEYDTYTSASQKNNNVKNTKQKFIEINKLLNIPYKKIDVILNKNARKFGVLDYDKYRDEIEYYKEMMYIATNGTIREQEILEEALRKYGYNFEAVEDYYDDKEDKY